MTAALKCEICLNILFEICLVVSNLSVETWDDLNIMPGTLDLIQSFCFLISVLCHHSSSKGLLFTGRCREKLKLPFYTHRGMYYSRGGVRV